MIRNSLLKKIFFTVVLTTFLFTLVAMPLRSSAEGDVCPIDNQAECQESQKAEIIGNESGHTENCDKTIYVFFGAECPKCQALKNYLNEMKKDHPEIEIRLYEVWHSNENLDLFKQKAADHSTEAKAVPTVFIGHQTFVGYASDDLTGVEIKKSIYDLYCIKEQVEERSIKIPLIGKVKIASLSIPVLTVVLGLIDGFNPCAMWALIALLTILLATEDRRKLRLVGTVFILSSWLIYFLFMAFYLNTFKLFSFITWIRYLIGLIAIFAGGMYLRDFITYQPGVCKVTNAKQQKSIMERMRRVASSNSLWLVVAGVIALAFSVNLVEMMCSIGLPIVYTQILSLSHLPSWQYYLYLALYNTLYMADDIIVFIIAAVTMNYVLLNHKYDRIMKLIGGVLILALGIILIFKPELLSF